MPFPSISLLRHLSPPCLTPRTTSLRLLSLAVTARRRNPSHNNPSRNKFQHASSKNLLKARQNTAAKQHYSNLAAVLSLDDRLNLSPTQALGLVAAAQANFMRVIVQSEVSQQHNNDRNSNNSNNDNNTSSNNRVGVELLCVVRALLKKIKRRVLVGDKVLVGSIDWVEKRGMIENVYERRSEILDPPVANVDHLVVLFSMDQPKIDPFALTRFLVEAESTGIPLTLALNKSELVDEESLKAWKIRLREWGYEPIFCSVESKHELDTLQFTLREQTSVIVGPSGVGKSSLINALRNHKPVLGATEVDNWFESMLDSKWFEDQRIGEVSKRSGKGKHTTRNVSLLPLSGGGYLADTPGFSQPSLMKVTKQSLAQYFPEIQRILEDSEPTKCSFNDCLHVGEPGCVVNVDWERYPCYFQLLDEIRIREEFQLRTIGTKREGDVRYKVGDMGVKQAEPRLERKKHRRQSRKTVNQSITDELDELDDDDDNDDLLDDSILRALRHEN